jgi:hypothetical protein
MMRSTDICFRAIIMTGNLVITRSRLNHYHLHFQKHKGTYIYLLAILIALFLIFYASYCANMLHLNIVNWEENT